MNEIERKLTAARTRLVLDKPFLGALVLRLPLKEVIAPWCTTTATDAKTFYFNPDYISPLTISQVQFVLAHEALHCGLSHFARRQHRNQQRWDLACDHAVNQILIEDGLEPPTGALVNISYRGMTAEEIYPLIPTDSTEQTQDQHLYDDLSKQNADDQPAPHNSKNPAEKESPQEKKEQQPDQSSNNKPEPDNTQINSTQTPPPEHPRHQQTTQPPVPQPDQPHPRNTDSLPRPSPLSTTERSELDTQWQQRFAGAAQQAAQAGKISPSVARMLDRVLRSSVPWRTVLARFLSGSTRTDYNLMRPSQRREGDAIQPSLSTPQTNVVIAVDTSGSIDEEELNLFIAEINALKSLVNARVTLVACDKQLDHDGPWIFEPWEPMKYPKSLQGNTGTDFTPVFNWLNTQLTQPDLLVYFTDAVGRFPDHAAPIETLWLVKGTAKVPWGQRIQLN